MRFLYCNLLILASYSCLVCAQSGEEEAASTEQQQNSGAAKQPKQQPGVRLISFDTVDKDIAIGLDYLLPFVKVPVKRKRNEVKPLVIVNSAAILSCGLVAAGGALVGHLIRSMGLENIVPDGKSDHSSGEHKARALLDEQTTNPLQIFDNFKLVYRNDSGERVETALPSLMDTIERTFLANDIDLPACLLKSLCTWTHKAMRHSRTGQATEVELLLDGVTSWSWLMSWLEQSALQQAIEAGRVASSHHCQDKYPRCKWTAPEEQLLQLLHNNVQFN